MRYEVRVVKGSARGDLYELEQMTHFQIVDLLTNKTVLIFQEKMEANLSRDNGLWENYHYSGVCEVTISPDEKTVLVKYHDGNQEYIVLPEGYDSPNPSLARKMGEQGPYEEPQPTSKDIQELVSFLRAHNLPVEFNRECVRGSEHLFKFFSSISVCKVIKIKIMFSVLK